MHISKCIFLWFKLQITLYLTSGNIFHNFKKPKTKQDFHFISKLFNITHTSQSKNVNVNIQNESKKEKKKKKGFLSSSPSFSFPRLFVFHFRLYFIRSYIRTGFVSPRNLPLLFFLQSICFSLTLSFFCF